MQATRHCPGAPEPAVLVLLFLSGTCRSIGFTAYNSVAFADVPDEHMTDANTLMSTVQDLGAGLGVAVGALLVRLGGPVGGAVGLHHDASTAFRVAFCALALILLVPAAEAFALPSTAGNTVTGRT